MRTIVLVLVAALFPAVALAGSASTVPGTWRVLASEPIALPYGASAWTGSRLIVFGRRPLTTKTYNPSANAAMEFDPARNTWTTLTPPPRVGESPACCRALWTGRQLLVFGAGVRYRPSAGAWRVLHASLPLGIVAWTGREAIGWGGGCCGDAQSNGAAYDPATDASRVLPRSPLAPSQDPVGAWDGRELLLLVSGYGPDGRPYPTGLARAAAYDPAADTWRRLAPLPARLAGSAAWSGRELILAGAGARGRAAFAYDPSSDRWRRLARLPSARPGATALWTRDRLILWGGAASGLAYDPATNRWSSIAAPPLRAPASASAVWTGRALLAFGGIIGSTAATGNQQVWLRDAAAFTPAARPS
jgi:N-acetylneuraminic acid mutarotase